MARPSLPTNGAAIKTIRTLQEMTSDVLGQRAGVSGAYVRNIEAGRRNASPAVLRRIAKALGVKLHAVMAPASGPPQ